MLLVLGCVPGCGTTTVALAAATAAAAAAGAQVRLVECCAGWASGLAGAATAELGERPGGWRRGRRDQVVVDRPGPDAAWPNLPPPPSCPGAAATVVDGGCTGPGGPAGPGWLVGLSAGAAAVVWVSAATVPGVRRLETILAGGGRSPMGVALVGVAGRRGLPRGLTVHAGPRVRAVVDAGLVVGVPWLPRLRRTGVDAGPLPPALLAAAARLLPPDLLIAEPAVPTAAASAETVGVAS